MTRGLIQKFGNEIGNTGTWPSYIAAIRHGQSAYNAKKEALLEDPEYKEFLDLFNEEYEKATILSFHQGVFPSDRLKELAIKFLEKLNPKTNDPDTPLTEEGERQAYETGLRLGEVITELPARIYVSPYRRTQETFRHLKRGAPQLEAVPFILDEKLREREHGFSTMYGDWRINYVLNPREALFYKFQKEYHWWPEGGETMANVRQRTKQVISTIIRRHGGAPETFEDLVLDMLRRKRGGLAQLLDAAGIQPAKKQEGVLMVTHHLHILALRAEMERWTDEQFVEANTNDRPPNCSVTLYTADNKPVNGGKYQGSMSLREKNRVLYSEAA